MAQTPEGKVKQKVSSILKNVPGLFYDMPVPGGYGGSTLDYVGCYRGRFFAIETKKPGGKPTPRQEHIIARMSEAGGAVFVIDGVSDDSLSEFVNWLGMVNREKD